MTSKTEKAKQNNTVLFEKARCRNVENDCFIYIYIYIYTYI